MNYQRKGWRRFVPKKRHTPKAKPGSIEHILYEALNNVRQSFRGTIHPSQLDEPIEELKQRVRGFDGAEKAAMLEALVVLQTPRAAVAQDDMDRHKHNYHDRTKRLFELIDFNDTFVDTVLSLPPEQLPNFAEHIKHHMLRFCAQYKLPMLSDEQYEAIVHGLSREIAVYLGAKTEGLDAEMTSRAGDAFGIDMVISDPTTGKRINVDCKTPSAFRHRLGELVHEGRITEDQLYTADVDDYISVENRRDEERVLVTIMCIRPEDLGEVVNFTFVDTAPLGRLLRKIIATS